MEGKVDSAGGEVHRSVLHLGQGTVGGGEPGEGVAPAHHGEEAGGEDGEGGDDSYNDGEEGGPPASPEHSQPGRGWRRVFVDERTCV